MLATLVTSQKLHLEEINLKNIILFKTSIISSFSHFISIKKGRMPLNSVAQMKTNEETEVMKAAPDQRTAQNSIAEH